MVSAQDKTQKRARTVTVYENGNGPYGQTIDIDRHRITADEPEEQGGNDSGPTPYDFILAGLGACTSMTMRMYAQRKGWKLKRVYVRLFHEKIHAEDCANCETTSGKLDRIMRIIKIDGDLDADQHKRLLEIADLCPVHKTLTSEIHIVTRASD